MIKACIFDLDGTLSDTLTTIAYYGNKSLNKFGLPSIPKERYRYLVGNGAKILVERMVREVEGDASLVETIFEDYTKAYETEPLYLTAPYAGIVDLLKALRERGVLIAVLSNKPHAPACAVVKTLFGEETFDCCYGQREGVPIKPDPAAVLGIMKELKVTAEECFYIGDTAVDMQTGTASGATSVGVLWGFRDRQELEENGAEVLLEHPMQLLEFLV